MCKPPAQHWRKSMTDLRDKIIGLLSPELCCRADRKADAIIALVVTEYEEFVFAIATKVSQRDIRIAELEAALAAKTLAELTAHMGMNDNDQPQEKETP